MTKFGSNATNSSATEINLEIFNLNFLATELEMEWKDNSSYRSNAWVRCASGKVFWNFCVCGFLLSLFESFPVFKGSPLTRNVILQISNST